MDLLRPSTRSSGQVRSVSLKKMVSYRWDGTPDSMTMVLRKSSQRPVCDPPRETFRAFNPADLLQLVVVDTGVEHGVADQNPSEPGT